DGAAHCNESLAGLASVAAAGTGTGETRERHGRTRAAQTDGTRSRVAAEEIDMTTKQTIYRQGDVLILRVETPPATGALIARDTGRVVLAYGEVTGHSHAIKSKYAKM